MTRQIIIPYRPRKLLMPFHARTQRWAVLVAHRRFGKTVGIINDMLKRALMVNTAQPIYKDIGPRYAYIGPSKDHAKDVAWEMIKAITANIPGVECRESDLHCNLPNGARIALYGGENYNRMRGLPFDGAAQDEDALIDPKCFTEVVRPCLIDRKGWAVFASTFKGMNHFHKRYTEAVINDEWYCDILPASRTGVIPEDELSALRRDMSEEQYAQEIECSPMNAVLGAYYRTQMQRIDAEKRISTVAWQPETEVHTAWDLGRSTGNATAIWFCQLVGNTVHVIDYEEATLKELPYFAKIVKEKPYTYGRHIVPHDARVTEWGTSKTRIESMEALGIRPEVAPQISLQDGIEATRAFLARCVFDGKKCERGINALREYQTLYNSKNDVYSAVPLHNWASNGADAFRYLAVAVKPSTRGDWSKPIKYPARAIV